MNPSSDDFTSSPSNPAASAAPPLQPANWREALMALVASRLALIQFEFKDVADETLRRVAKIAVACACVFFAWALILVGAISWTAAKSGWPWHWVALGFAGAHLLVAMILAISSRSTGRPKFPVTRAEFQKDRVWIENFNKDTKSSG